MATLINSHSKTHWLKLALGLWGFYFIAKLGLYWAGFIGFHAWENLAFAVFILIPVNHLLILKIKQATTLVLAVGLLYYDSWLPPASRVWEQAAQLSQFSAAYIVELLLRFISLPVLVALLVAGVIYALISRWLRLDVLVILAMLAVAGVEFFSSPAPLKVAPKQFIDDEESLMLSGEGVDKNQAVQQFLQRESARAVFFPAPKLSEQPFDIIFMQVCSLSWDDLQVMGLAQHPLWQRFDILLTRFNSASTYSGPAAIRMQRAACGQAAHDALYVDAPDKCYLMSNLQRAGFEPALVLNHNGQFDHFLKTVQTLGRLSVQPMPLSGAAVVQHAFDGTPIYDDFSVLMRWLKSRQQSRAPRVAMYYNTISLHDGNRLLHVDKKPTDNDSYKIRLTKFLDDMEKFMHNLEQSGRRAVVVMVPEHGAAVRGDKMQMAGLREIPSPAITRVPVGIKIIGNNVQRDGATLLIDKPTSYLAISYLIARLVENTPYKTGHFSPTSYVKNIPTTLFLSQNETIIMADFNGQYYLRQHDETWHEYSE